MIQLMSLSLSLNLVTFLRHREPNSHLEMDTNVLIPRLHVMNHFRINLSSKNYLFNFQADFRGRQSTKSIIRKLVHIFDSRLDLTSRQLNESKWKWNLWMLTKTSNSIISVLKLTSIWLWQFCHDEFICQFVMYS